MTRDHDPCIVAAACRFPDADSPERFWQNLVAGVGSIREAPEPRRHPDPAARHGAFLADVRGFDAAFFGIDDAEAAVTDPQQRILLEVAHEALERAGMAGPRRRARKVAVFVGVGQSDYAEPLLRLLWSGAQLHPATAVGNLRNLIAARVAHAMDLDGPAIAVDTACSSSLVALHLAREALARGECDLALACGVTLNLTPTSFAMLARAGALSPTGRCRPFAQGADGIALGEGVAAVVLERLADARTRGAGVHAILRGSAVNNDGRTFTPMAPKPAGQIAVMRAAWDAAGLDPRSATFIEAHGTGTRVGDSVEARSVAAVMGRASGDALSMGSVKGNVGHMLSAAGMPSVIKTALALDRRILPESLHAASVDPKHGLGDAGIELVAQTSAWTSREGPLRAGINGFGFGGTNAHVILEEPPPPPRRTPRARAVPPLLASAHTDGALRTYARALAAWIDAHPEADAAAIAASVGASRDARPHRIAVIGAQNLAQRLRAWAEGGAPEGVLHGVVEASREALEASGPLGAAQRFVSGLEVDVLEWSAGCELLALPTYPFEHRAFWVDEPATDARADHALITRTLEASIDRFVCVAHLSPDDPVVREHLVRGAHVLPGAAAIELLRAAASEALGREPAALAEVTFARPIVVERERTLRVVVERGRGGELEARIEDEAGTSFARAEVRREAASGIPEARAHAAEAVRFEVEALYAALASRGMSHGESFRGLTELWVGDREVSGRVVVPEAARGRAFGIHPALLDAAMQPVAAILLAHAPEADGLFVPFHLEAVELFAPIADACWSRITMRDDPAAPADAVRCDVEVSDDAGVLALRLRGLSLRRLGGAPIARDVTSFFHEVSWEPDPIRAAPISGSWLITPADHPLAIPLAERIARDGGEAERVPPQEIAEPLRRRRRAGIAFLGPTERASSDASEPPGALVLLGVARVLDELALDARPPRLLVVTAGATDGAEPLHAPLAALGGALSDELRGIAARVLDVSLDEATETVSEITAQELGAPDGAAVVRVRGGLRARRSVVAAQLHDAEPIAIRDHGVYLIIGGASGIGAALAQALAAPGRTIVVTSRTPPGASATRDAAVSALRATGATVEHLACDVTSTEDVARLIARVVREHGPIHGVVHGAGIAEPRRIGARDDETARRVMAPKVGGTVVLARELERHGQRPDFVALLSSISAVWPGLGGALSDYAAANAFLDAFATARREAGWPFVSIAWSVWSETGMGNEPALLAAMEARGLPGIGTRAGVDAFFRALSLDRAHVIVAPRRPPRIAATFERDAGGEAGPIAAEIRSLVARALVVPEDQVRTDASFLAMGLDSLTALELVKVLEQRHDVSLPSTLFFELQTVDALAAHLARTIRRPHARPEATPSEARGATPLLPTQAAFYLNARLYPDVAAYSFSRQTVRGPIDLDALRAATAAVVRRHPMLRASIDGTDPRTPVQRIVPACEPVVIDHGVTGDIEALAEKAANTLFDPSKPPLLRVHVARDAGGRFDHVMLCAHHVVADAWSLHVIAIDLWRAYARPERFDDAPLAPCFLGAPRPDPGEVDAALGWWREKLASLPDLRLPFDGDPSAPPAPPLASVAVRLDRAQTAEVTEAAAASGVSLFHLTLAAHARCLARWCGARDVVINVARARRELRAPGIADAVGCFADTLPLRLSVDTSEPLSATAARARDGMLELEQHAAPTSGDIARIVRESGRGPRVASPASYSFARFPLAAPDEAPRMMSVTGRTASAATQLGLAAWEVGGELSFSFNYPSSLFHRSTIDRLARDLLSELSAARQPEARPRSVAERLWDALLEAGPRTVLRDGPRSVSGDALWAAAGGVARALRDRGVRRGDVVGLVAEQGLEGIAGVIGVLFSGAAFLPIDPAHPERRAIDQLDRGGARICLHASDTYPRLDSLSLGEAIGRAPIEAPAPARDDDLAYVMFTSGSTGRPKGVPITNGAIRGYLDWVLATFGYGPGDVCLGTASLSFDASVRQVLAPLLAGATLIACPRVLARDPDGLLEAVRDEGVTVLSTVPSLLAQVVRRDPAPLAALSWLNVGGEALPPALVRALFDRLDRTPPIANLYGPTEATINATYHVIHERPADDAARIPIGRAAAGARLEVSDEGELLVGGPGVFAGYVGDPDGSAHVFVEGREGGRLYRTGDRVRVRPDGLLEHLGRIDDQVKIHGQRVEPGEVEAVLGEHPAVALAVVRATGEEPLRALEAWIVAHGEVGEDALRTWCEERLPDAMRPRRYHLVDALPTTAADKVDRAALARPTGTSPEATLALVRLAFAEVLRIGEVGPDEDFFRLGGDSMGVLEVLARLEKVVPSVPRAATLYRARTARALARAIEAHGEDHGDATPATGADAPWFPLSPAQRGFLLARAIDPESSVQWTARLSIEGPLDFARLREAARVVFLRHPMLRVVIDPERRAQQVIDAFDPPLSLETTPDDASVERIVREARQLRLDASVAPPIRMWLCRRTAAHHVLVVTADHVLGDALSGWILAGELLDAYDALCRDEVPELEPVRSTFREWVSRSRDRDDEAQRIAAWRRIFEAPYAPPDGLDRDVRSATFTLSEDRVDALRGAAARMEGTLYELVLAAYVHALRELTGRDDLVIGTALSGREDGGPDLARVIGPFATALPVRVRTAGRPPRATLDATRRAFAEARANALSAGEIARALPNGMPIEVASGLQLFFTFMDFEVVHTLRSETLRVRWLESEGDLPDGVDVHLSARRLEGALRLVLHGAVDGEALDGLRDRVLDVLDEYAGAAATSATLGVCFGAVTESSADTALIGYLPTPSAMAAAAGLPDGDAMRETLRAQLFPDGRPRWLERIDTPLGSSALLCLPLFADEIVPARAEALADAVAAAASIAGEAGIGSASLAGMLPSHTGYGHAVVARLNGGPHAELTTGHATTVVAVVRTVLLACEAARVDLGAATVAFVGVGSIGGASAELLLSLGEHPRRIVLCDLARAGGRMRDVAETLRERGYAGRIELAESGATLPDTVYRAQVIVGAASTPRLLDVSRLAPGTVVVDDSFPHLFDSTRARARMRSRGDVLVVGGGLLDPGPIRRTLDVPPALAPFRAAIARAIPRSAIASCQLEPLLRRCCPDLPPTLGLVTADAARLCWDAAERLGVRAAKLHLGPDPISDAVLAAIAGPWSRGVPRP